MKSKLKLLLFTTMLGSALLFGNNAMAQTKCCTGDKAKADCKTTAIASNDSTSGCSPSACKGAKTKFGEAAVITDLRSELIALKADMEKSENPSFDAKSYDIHGIVGKTDDESLEIIVKEIRKVEKAFAERANYSAPELSLPENKAKKVQYLSQRIQSLKGYL